MYASSEGAQVWSLVPCGGAGAAPDSQWQLAPHGVAVACVDHVDAERGESLRLYFDAEVEEDMAGPMASSLAVVDLPAAAAATSAPPSPGRAAREGAAPPPLDAAWAGAASAWYPDAAYVCCGHPGHYLGCLVWSEAKADAILAALSPSHAAPKALVFAYARHPADASMLGKPPGAPLQLLVQVPARTGSCEDLWCRLPGGLLARMDGMSLADHHGRRMRELRASRGDRGAAAGALGQLSSCGAFAAGVCDALSGHAAGAGEAGLAAGAGCDVGLALETAFAPLTLTLPDQALAASGRAGSGCPSVAPSVAASTPFASSTPSRRSSTCSEGASCAGCGACGGGGAAAGFPSGGALCGDDAASPFAGLLGGSMEEEWQDEFVLVAAGGW